MRAHIGRRRRPAAENDPDQRRTLETAGL